MAMNSDIQWTDATFNPWWGCLKVSSECKFCYAEKWANRMGNTKLWGPAEITNRRFFGEKHWNEPIKWNKQARQQNKRIKVFCASMADVFEDNPILSNERLKVWELIEKTPFLDWQLLTKRPENITSMIPADWLVTPPKNVWYGASIGEPSTLWRLLELKKVPACLRWLSLEPLIEYLGDLNLNGIHWVIVGGESGPLNKIRHTQLEWMIDLRSQCAIAGVPFFVKQLGSRWSAQYKAKHSKGGDINEWPLSLQVRQFPK